MAFFRGKKRFLSLWLLLVVLFTQISVVRAALIDIDIPIEPVRPLEYTEDLFEVTDDGVFDGEGNIVDVDEVDSTEAASALSLTEIPVNPDGATDDDSFEAYRQSLIENWGGKKSFTEERLQGVKQNLTEQKDRFRELEKQIAKVEEQLAPLQEESNTLKGQIDLINGQVRITKEKIDNVESLIAEKQVEIKDLMLNLRRSEIELKIQEGVVVDYVKLLYQEENEYFSLHDEGADTLKLLLADTTVSENLLGRDYLAIMEETGRRVFYDLDRTRIELAEKKQEVADEQAELEYLRDILVREKRTLEETRLSKKDLLEETQGKEEEYQFILEQAIQQQLEAAIAVQNLQENISLIESKLSVLDDGLSTIQTADAPDDLGETEETIEILDSATGEEQAIEVDKKSGKPFAWPIPPNKITAKFHDEHYPKKWGVHNAIDIRAAQFSEIHAPANGYVFQTKDNGNGYSYIILAHKGNLITVYGHVSEILVQAGTIVKQGQVIGLSGGTPGTKGAGLQTTGPHLHFEVHYRGEAVNPLDYLPLNELPLEYVPDEYLKKLK